SHEAVESRIARLIDHPHTTLTEFFLDFIVRDGFTYHVPAGNRWRGSYHPARLCSMWSGIFERDNEPLRRICGPLAFPPETWASWSGTKNYGPSEIHAAGVAILQKIFGVWRTVQETIFRNQAGITSDFRP